MKASPIRSLDQNALMWAMLNDISMQLKWPVDGKMVHMDAEDWKHVLTAGIKKTQRIAAGVDGGFVILGTSTRRMRIGEMAELIEFIEWFAAEKGVAFSLAVAEASDDRG